MVEPVDSLFQKGIEYLNQRKYKEAERVFNQIIYHHPGSAYLADAQFFLAETYYQKKDYQLAKEEFSFFLKNFPASKYQEEASYKYARSFLLSLPKITKDQEEILELKEFILDFKEQRENSSYLPQMESLLLEVSNRLAEKEFAAGLLYYKAGEWQSAQVYFEYVSKEFPNTEAALEAKYLLGEICWRNGEREKAKEIFEELLAKPIKEERKKRITKVLAGLPTPVVVKPPEEPPVKSSVKLEAVYFDLNESNIRLEDTVILKKNAEILKQHPDVKVTIEGHCCPLGTSEYNIHLGLKRAEFVKNYLVKLGIDADRLKIISYGEEMPVTSDEKEYWKNRRCEFKIE